jgi:predicted RNase H-like nuclease (RuvC/YqgF family)
MRLKYYSYLVVIAIALSGCMSEEEKAEESVSYCCEGEGEMLYRELTIDLQQDMKILQILTKEKDAVKEGDKLFLYITESDKVSERLKNLYSKKQRFEAKLEVAAKEAEVAKAKLESHRSAARKLDPYLHKVQELEFEINTVNSKIKKEEQRFITQQAELQDSSIVKTYRAPVTGFISRIFNSPYRYQDAIMRIGNAKSPYIRAYFMEEDWPNLTMGDIIEIELPNGKKTQGKLEEYRIPIPNPIEASLKTKPSTTVAQTFSANIVPLKPKDAKQWRAHYQKNVRLAKRN